MVVVLMQAQKNNNDNFVTSSQKLIQKFGGEGFVEKNIDKLKVLRSWILWYPDLFMDLMSPTIGSIKLGFDQRFAMRCDSRFAEFHNCSPRGSAKTFGNVWVAFVDSIVLPSCEIALSAQTKENAANLLSDKYAELTKWIPMLKNEIKKYSHTKNDTVIEFRNDSSVDVLPNSQNAKGARRKRLRCEESNLIDNETFEDALKPVVEVPRYTRGKLAIVDPCELNQQICFYTTPGWRGSDEHKRVLSMIDKMVNLKGTMVIGSNWMLPCWYGRGSTKSQILDKKRTMGVTAFLQNYGGTWTGVSSGALVSINNLIKCRNLEQALYGYAKDAEIIIGVDVARSSSDANNKSSIAVLRVSRDSNNRPISFDLVNIFDISNSLNYTKQSLIIKQTKERYKAKIVVLDANGLGIGLMDELMKETKDTRTGIVYPCYNTINTQDEVENQFNSEDCLFAMKSQGYQTKILSTFIDCVDSGSLHLLVQKNYDIFESEKDNDYQEKFMPYVETSLLVDEIANLKLETDGKNLKVRQEVKRIDKDRFSALSYALYYAVNEMQDEIAQDQDWTEWAQMRSAKIRV